MKIRHTADFVFFQAGMINFERWAKRELKRRQISPPTRSQKWRLRILILLGMLSFCLFVIWFCQAKHIGQIWLYLLLTFAVGFKLLRTLHEWYHYWDISVPKRPESTREWTVDMLTTYVAGEPYDMIEETLQAMVNVAYPHETWLCDEANDPYLIEFCQKLGVHHVYRGKDKSKAKAGNINYALENHAKGEITVILDPDHVPTEDFLDRVLPYFEDEKVGYVQCVQTYGNQQESFVAKGAAEQTYHFYGPMMMSMHAYGTAQAIGANCSFRRAALDQIGGHAAGLSEDMHTAMRIHGAGWKSVYVPEQLTRGRVPSNLQAYYKQQLKWSRGTFELLFHVYPKLFKSFSWRQRLHYFLLPFHFLSGLITLIDILVPILSLVLAVVPWHMDLIELAQMATPLLIMVMLIRQYAQSWLLEEQERGFHLLGGILWSGTWWISLTGFAYSLFGVKVPYIPTPKEDELTNAFKLSLPNIIAVILSIVAIIYGLSIDWNPYSFAMAGFALVNALILGMAVLMGQQKMMDGLYQFLKLEDPITRLRTFWWNLRHYVLYRLVRSSALILTVLMILFWGGYAFVSQQQLTEMKQQTLSEEEPYAWFYLGGAALPESVPESSKLISYKLTWGNLPQWDSMPAGMPLIDWLPGRSDSALCAAVYNGGWDGYLTEVAQAFQNFDKPVMIRLAANPDQAQHGFAVSNRNSAEEYKIAWEYIVGFMARKGLGQISWVFQLAHSDSLKAYMPSSPFIHWLGVEAHDQKHLDQFTQQIESIKAIHQKPLLLQSNGQWNWEEFPQKFPTIRGLILAEEESRAALWAEIQQGHPFYKFAPDIPFAEKPDTVSRTRQPSFFKGKGSETEWMVDGKSFYVKGVAYNATHDWRDGFLPLTRRQLEKDFARIRDMGANAIRRFDGGVYDENILTIAQEHGLKVNYGIWLDPEIDYLRDTTRLLSMKADILKEIAARKNAPALLAWTLGNEAWTGLKYHYRPPYLYRVRRAFVDWVEELAQEIHALDPNHPVMLALEHSDHLPAALVDFNRRAPAIDIIGINSFHGARIAELDEICQRYLPDQPYLLTGFGPRKYWDQASPEYAEDRMLPAVSSFEKAETYGEIWTQHIQPNQNKNLGGFAYCWSDRLEGAATWFGITDFKGRLKPAYYVLQSLFKDQDISFPLADLMIRPPDNGVRAGKEAIFHAISPNNHQENLNYEWYLLQEQVLENTGWIKKLDKGFGAKVRIPDKPDTYRLYLHVSDQTGNVVTASHRIVYLPEK